SKIASESESELAPGGGNDRGLDKRPLDSVERGRLVAFIDDADGRQHHAGADVEIGLDQEVEIGLFQRDFAALLLPFDQRVLQLKFAPELDAIRKTVAEQEHEAVKIRLERFSPVFICVKL